MRSTGSMHRSACIRTTPAKVDDAGWREIAASASSPRVVAIGETGLDYDRVFSPIPDQLTNLRRNLELALETGKPAILHVRSRDGQARCPGRRSSRSCARPASGPSGRSARSGRTGRRRVIHSFSGSVDYARQVLDLGLAISFSGPRLPGRRGGDGATWCRSCPPIGCSSRPIRRSSRRPAGRRAETSPSGSGSRPGGSESAAATTRRRSATRSSPRTTATFRARQRSKVA